MSARVLVVDDQRQIRELITDILEMAGYQVITASNGKEGVRRLYEARPDVVITDLVMPEMDGFEFSRIVRMACDVPIMMLTGLGPGSDGHYQLNLVDDFIMKPVSLYDLTSRVEGLLSGDRREPGPKLIVIK